MDLKQLEAFVAACEEDSFSAAAGRRGVTQSTLSGRIADLEKSVGAQLFDRSVRPVRITRAGEVLLRHARVALRELDSAVSEIKQLDGELTGKLRLGLIEVAGLSAPNLERALAAFHARHRYVELVISDPSSRGIVEGVQKGQLDMGVVGYRRSYVPPSLGHFLIADREVVALVASTHPLAQKEQVTLAQLAETGPSVELREGTGVRLELDMAFARAGVVRSIGVEVATTAEALRYAAFGFGYALVPDSALFGRRPGRSVSVLKLARDRICHPIAVIYEQPQPASPAATELLAWLRSTCVPPGLSDQQSR